MFCWTGCSVTVQLQQYLWAEEEESRNVWPGKRELGWLLPAAYAGLRQLKAIMKLQCQSPPSDVSSLLALAVYITLGSFGFFSQLSGPSSEPWKNKREVPSVAWGSNRRSCPGPGKQHEPSGTLTAVLQQGPADPLAFHRLAPWALGRDFKKVRIVALSQQPSLPNFKFLLWHTQALELL